MKPIKIGVTDHNSLNIIWNDNSISDINLLTLRKFCPCAICSEEEEKFSHSHKIYRGDQLVINELSIVGSYAIAIEWKDGHNTGIYEFQYLIELSNND